MLPQLAGIVLQGTALSLPPMGPGGGGRWRNMNCNRLFLSMFFFLKKKICFLFVFICPLSFMLYLTQTHLIMVAHMIHINTRWCQRLMQGLNGSLHLITTCASPVRWNLKLNSSSSSNLFCNLNGWESPKTATKNSIIYIYNSIRKRTSLDCKALRL